MLSVEVDKQKKEAYRLNEGAIQYTMVRHEFDSSRDLYDGLLKKLKEAGITAGLRSTNVTVVDPATAADEPSEPKLPRNVALGLGMGLFLGVMLAFVRENLDNTLRTTEEIEFYSGLPSLGIIPLPTMSNNGHTKLRGALPPLTAEAVELVTLSHPKSHISESFRSLRSSVLLSSVDVPIKIMVVTSSIPGEGKRHYQHQLGNRAGAKRQPRAAGRCRPAPSSPAPVLQRRQRIGSEHRRRRWRFVRGGGRAVRADSEPVAVPAPVCPTPPNCWARAAWRNYW